LRSTAEPEDVASSVLLNWPAKMVFVSGPVPWASGTATTAVIEHVAFAEIVPAVIVSVPVPTPPKTGAPQFALPTADTSVKLAGKLSVIAAFVSGTDVKSRGWRS